MFHLYAKSQLALKQGMLVSLVRQEVASVETGNPCFICKTGRDFC